MLSVVTPPQKVPPLEADGLSFQRQWYLYFTNLTAAVGEFIRNTVYGRPNLSRIGRITRVTAEGTIGEAAFLDTDVVQGAPNLTHANRLLKVSAANVATESAVSDDGTTVSTTEPVTVDTGASTSTSQLGVRANTAGFIGFYISGADASALEYDLDVVAGAGVARHAAVVAVRKGGSKLTWLGSTGNTVGNAPTLNTLGTLDLANGRWGFGNVAAPGYSVDAQTDVNAGGIFRKGGAAGITGSLTLTPTTQVVQYKDWTGANQSVTVVTAVAITANAFSGGIRTT